MPTIEEVALTAVLMTVAPSRELYERVSEAAATARDPPAGNIIYTGDRPELCVNEFVVEVLVPSGEPLLVGAQAAAIRIGPAAASTSARLLLLGISGDELSSVDSPAFVLRRPSGRG